MKLGLLVLGILFAKLTFLQDISRFNRIDQKAAMGSLLLFLMRFHAIPITMQCIVLLRLLLAWVQDGLFRRPLLRILITHRDMQFYPNPASEKLSVSLMSRTSNCSFIIYDRFGNVVLPKDQSIQFGLNQVDLNIASLINGMYILEIKSPENISISRKKFSKL